MKKIIIHISGPPGAGKTTMGQKFKDELKDKIVVKDLDELRDEFINDFYGNQKWLYLDVIEYQNYINNFINAQDKPIVFVGLNDNHRGKNKYLYFNVQAIKKYYIDIDDMVIVEQRCLRYINTIQYDKPLLTDLLQNNDYFIERVTDNLIRSCSIKNVTAMNNRYKTDYKNLGYIFMSREKIYKVVMLLLNKNLKSKY